MTDSRPLLAGVELGGTKCICILGTGADDIRKQVRVPTGEPDTTLARINSVLDAWRATYPPPAAIGLASFGPLDLRRGSPAFGQITSTAKPGWVGTDIVARLGVHRGIPIGFNTDVNGAALAEGRWGAARGLEDYAYVTVGTGVGVGLVVGGRPVFGCNHSELGHMRVVRHGGDDWPGACPFHGDCVEGLVSGPAIAARAGMPASEIPAASPVWELVAHTLAQLLQTMFLATAPQRVLIGGGVVEHRADLLERVQRLVVENMNGYLNLEDLTGGMNHYVVAPGLGSLAGPLGALALAAEALTSALAAAS
ncbi:MAG: ROK family protein [Steroidobacteraceae bacterium]